MYAYATNFKKIELILDNYEIFNANLLKIYDNTNLVSIDHCKINEKNIEIVLTEEINIKNQYIILYDNHTIPINYFPLYQSYDFNNRFYYDRELGLTYTNEYSTFKVWTPVAESVLLLLYKNGDPNILEKPRIFKMDETNGVFSITINENLKGLFYQYEVTVFKQKNIVVDPYAKAVGINGLRGAIIDMKDTNPNNWEYDFIDNLNNYTDAIIYETSIRDISMHPDSGIKNKGKFLGLAETNTKSSRNLSTGLSHIKELGITHVQLMPFFDFIFTSTDERNPIDYNWGYDPQNYNVPEGSYTTDPYSPICRIKELKQMILQLHKNGLHINMDVVYNHVFYQIENNFEKVFPGYYFRKNQAGILSNGSGCGNDTASENKMMQKFILDSVIFWRDEYHIDGFRFDLMGLHDLGTMNLVKEKLNSAGKNIMIYGEGWDLSTTLPYTAKAIKANARFIPKVGFFNDLVRDVIKGNVFDLNERGFVSGKRNLEGELKEVILGSRTIFTSPEQSINYVSCHDNSTLWDKFQHSNIADSVEDRIKMVKLSTAIILTCQGVPFLHSGEEFLRTKFGEHNSYRSSDKINALDWERKYVNLEVCEYCIGLIKLRKLHPAFRMNNYIDIQNNIHFLEGTPDNIVAYIIKNNANGDTRKNILVIINGNKNSSWVTIPSNQWYLTVDENKAGVEPIKYIDSPRINVAGISMYVAFSI